MKTSNNTRSKPITTVFAAGYGYPNDFRLAATHLAHKFGAQAAADAFKVSVGSVYNWINALGSPSVYKNTGRVGDNHDSIKPMRNSHAYYEEDRVHICNFAMEYNVAIAHETFGAAKSSIYGWLKTYNMQTAYWNTH